ncbi:MAG: class I SAM-dependent methyltransferase [Armatimonadetes bacterium]|nr:class I SAM-dependent methyltransferase [Armatimonadota bacterium]
MTALPETILQFLQCPKDGGVLSDGSSALLCATCGAMYPLRDGIADFGDLVRGEEEQTLLEYYENEHPGCNLRLTSWKVEQLAALLGGAGAQSVLDVGCGMGEIARSAAELTHARCLVGVDWSGPILRAGAANPVPEGLQAGWLRANALCLPIRDDAFDLMLAVDIVEHVVEPDRLFAEARRVARRLFVKIPLGGRLRPWRENFGHIHRFSLSDCRKLLDNAGWRITGERFPSQPVFPLADRGALYNTYYVARRTLNQRLRRIFGNPRWYCALAERA